jgi:hypothetical protein
VPAHSSEAHVFPACLNFELTLDAWSVSRPRRAYFQRSCMKTLLLNCRLSVGWFGPCRGTGSCARSVVR